MAVNRTSLKKKINAFYFKIQVILRGEHSAQLVCHRLALFKFILIQNSCHTRGEHIYILFFLMHIFQNSSHIEGRTEGGTLSPASMSWTSSFFNSFYFKIHVIPGGTHIYTSFKYFFNAFYFKIQVILKGELRGEHSAQLVCRILKVPPCPASMS